MDTAVVGDAGLYDVVTAGLVNLGDAPAQYECFVAAILRDDAQAARQSLLAHLPPEVRCRVTAVVYRHADNVATVLSIMQPATAR